MEQLFIQLGVSGVLAFAFYKIAMVLWTDNKALRLEAIAERQRYEDKIDSIRTEQIDTLRELNETLKALMEDEE